MVYGSKSVPAYGLRNQPTRVLCKSWVLNLKSGYRRQQKSLSVGLGRTESRGQNAGGSFRTLSCTALRPCYAKLGTESALYGATPAPRTAPVVFNKSRLRIRYVPTHVLGNVRYLPSRVLCDARYHDRHAVLCMRSGTESPGVKRCDTGSHGGILTSVTVLVIS
eukprot:1457981-Rhodomonas_salina.3